MGMTARRSHNKMRGMNWLQRAEDLREALKWALDEIKSVGNRVHPPDDPFWNDYHRACAVLENCDPDKPEPIP